MSLLLTASVNLDKCDPDNMTPEQVDSFCQLYTKVVVNKGDGQIQAPAAVKKRLLVNEKLYQRVCPQAS